MKIDIPVVVGPRAQDQGLSCLKLGDDLLGLGVAEDLDDGGVRSAAAFESNKWIDKLG